MRGHAVLGRWDASVRSRTEAEYAQQYAQHLLLQRRQPLHHGTDRASERLDGRVGEAFGVLDRPEAEAAAAFRAHDALERRANAAQLALEHQVESRQRVRRHRLAVGADQQQRRHAARVREDGI